jgi:RHS repeat-associated protein
VEAEEEAPPAQSNGGSIPEPGTWQLDSTYKYVWDGWLLSLELDGKNNPIRSNACGPDLSGSTQGAGGVGGLALMTDHLGNGGVGGAANTYHITYDHNGNVMSLRDRLGNTAARYEYGPFGESLTARDALAGTNPWRFSTKYADAETGLYYYGYRYYNASTGRWLNRDPIEELGGKNTFDLPPFPMPHPIRELRASLPAAWPAGAKRRAARQHRPAGAPRPSPAPAGGSPVMSGAAPCCSAAATAR